MIELEDSCVYCSKCLVGLNDFNRKMHMNTCKVRKIVDGNLNLDQQHENFLLGENCTYCFKSFKDFKSDFNKRIHLRCCKIKKESLIEKQQMPKSNYAESCAFCSKPLANLNDFNKRMHIDNCKIRKSIEGSDKSKDDLNKIYVDLGDSCLYCSKSFVNLSDFNKKLHFDHCKFKKKKADFNSNDTNNLNPVANAVTSLPVSLNNTLNGSQVSLNMSTQQANQLLSRSLLEQNTNDLSKIDFGNQCLFCSRSLMNLSNFNKRIHVETCKNKKLKNEQSKLKQAARVPRKRPSKKDKERALNFFSISSCLDEKNLVKMDLGMANLSQYEALANTSQLQMNTNNNHNHNGHNGHNGHNSHNNPQNPNNIYM